MKKEIAHRWISTDSMYQPDKLNPHYCEIMPLVCVHTAYARQSGYSTCHISMLPHYDRIATKRGAKTIWHDQKPYWIK